MLFDLAAVLLLDALLPRLLALLEAVGAEVNPVPLLEELLAGPDVVLLLLMVLAVDVEFAALVLTWLALAVTVRSVPLSTSLTLSALGSLT